jgi:hypothetical protein
MTRCPFTGGLRGVCGPNDMAAGARSRARSAVAARHAAGTHGREDDAADFSRPASNEQQGGAGHRHSHVSSALAPLSSRAPPQPLMSTTHAPARLHSALRSLAARRPQAHACGRAAAPSHAPAPAHAAPALAAPQPRRGVVRAMAALPPHGECACCAAPAAPRCLTLPRPGVWWLRRLPLCHPRPRRRTPRRTRAARATPPLYR